MAGMGAGYHYTQGRLGNMGGLGSFTEMIANVVAEDEINQLHQSFMSLNDALVLAYTRLDEIREQEQEAKQRFAVTQSMGLGSIDTSPIGIVELEALEGISEGYRYLTAFSYMVKAYYDVFSYSQNALAEVYPPISQLLLSFKNWIATYQSKISTYPGMRELWDEIHNKAVDLRGEHWKKTGEMVDMKSGEYISTAMEAIKQVTGIDIDTVKGQGVGLLVTGLIAIITVTIGIVASLVTVLAVIKEYNVKANNMHEQYMAFQKSLNEEKDSYISDRMAEGASREEAEKEWREDVEPSMQENFRQDQENYAEKAGGPPSAGLVSLLIPAAVVVGGGVVLSKVL